MTENGDNYVTDYIYDESGSQNYGSGSRYPRRRKTPESPAGLGLNPTRFSKVFDILDTRKYNGFNQILEVCQNGVVTTYAYRPGCTTPTWCGAILGKPPSFTFGKAGTLFRR